MSLRVEKKNNKKYKFLPLRSKEKEIKFLKKLYHKVKLEESII